DSIAQPLPTPKRPTYSRRIADHLGPPGVWPTKAGLQQGEARWHNKLKSGLVFITFGRSKQAAKEHEQSENADEKTEQKSEMDRHIVFNAGGAHPKRDWKHELDHGFRSFHSAQAMSF